MSRAKHSAAAVARFGVTADDQADARAWWGCGCTRCVRAYLDAPHVEPCDSTLERLQQEADERKRRERGGK